MKIKTWLLTGAAMLACAPAPASAQGILSWLKSITQDNGSTILRSTPTSAADPLPVTSGTGASASQVQGSVASGAADSGNPVKIGGVYNTTLPTLTNGQRGDAQMGAKGSLYTSLIDPQSGALSNLQTFAATGLTNSVTGPVTISRGYLTNGTTSDAAVSVGQAQTTGTTAGVAAVGGYQAATASAAINVSTAVTTQLVALSGGKLIYVSALDFVAAGTTNVTLEYGTGSLCGTGTTVLTGAYPMTAQAGLSKGNGSAAFWIVPSGNALCMVNSQAIQVSGSVSYAQQ